MTAGYAARENSMVKIKLHVITGGFIQPGKSKKKQLPAQV